LKHASLGKIAEGSDALVEHAIFVFPAAHQRRLRTGNPLERVNMENPNSVLSSKYQSILQKNLAPPGQHLPTPDARKT
jgi:hypothetical protein